MSKTKKSSKESVAPKVNARPPIVTIMGHVDHGKTSLLDYIRKTHVQIKEAGGITQHIGAYQITYQNHLITFIDTPGHAAFNQMRSRGAKVTDIVVLVIAATEGVKPQTIESINHIKSAGVACIIAINKMDMPGADPMLVKSELAKYDILVEEFGGQTPVIEVSAKTGQGVDGLLEMIKLVGDLNPVDANPTAPVEAVIIESSLSIHKGPIATVIVKNGTLSLGDYLYVGEDQVKIRSLMDNQGKPVKSAGPSTPVEIAGFKSVPPVGSTIGPQPITPVAESAPELAPPQTGEPTNTTLSKYEAELQALLEEKDVAAPPHINIILKTDVVGTLEAIKSSLPDEVIIIDSGIGDVNDSDIRMASSTKSVVIAFNVKVGSVTQAQMENVKIKHYTVIYKLLEDIEKIILKLLEPTIDEEALGEATISQIFEMKGDRIAGCKVTMGEIKKTDLIHLIRDAKIIADVKISSLKTAKSDIEKIKVGSECGIVLKPQTTFQIGDSLQAYRVKVDL